MKFRELYQKLYDEVAPKHPRKGRIGRYGEETHRNHYFVDAVRKRLQPPAKIFDAGCGRGHLMRELLGLGYRVEGSEICIMDDLAGLVVTRHSYQELDRLPAGSFEAVISSDVLEHLESIDLPRALENLCRLSSRWVFISVGLVPARNFPQAMPWLGVDDLHLTVETFDWWHGLISEYVDIEETESMRRNGYFHGVKK